MARKQTNPIKTRETMIRQDAQKKLSLTKLSDHGFSHTLSEHINVDDVYLLDRLLTEHDIGGTCSRYHSLETANAVISAICAKFAQELAGMKATSGKRSFVGKLSDLRLAKTTLLCGIERDPITGRIYEVKTDMARLIVTGNPDPSSPYNITDISSYPCLLPDNNVVPNTQKTKRLFTSEIKRTAFYRTASPLLKAYLEQCCTRTHNLQSRWNPTDQTLVINPISSHMPKTAACRIIMREDSYRTLIEFQVESVNETYNGSPIRTISRKQLLTQENWNEFEKRFPQDSRAILAIAQKSTQLRQALPRPRISVSSVLSDTLIKQPEPQPKTKSAQKKRR